LDRVLWEQTGIWVQVRDELEQHQRFGHLCGFWRWILRV
jgi:hypothetical protein